MKSGMCHICLNKRPLHGKSHVIPDFMFRIVREYPKQQLMHVNVSQMVRDQQYVPKEQRRRPHVTEMLCTQCESLMHRYDDYIDAVIKNPSKKRNVVVSEACAYPTRDLLFVWSEPDAWRIPLFILSVVLRGAIASGCEPFYSNIKISDSEIERLRRLVLQERWTDEILDYDLIIIKTDSTDPEHFSRAIPTPEVYSKTGDRLHGMFMAGGAFFLIGRPYPSFEFSNAIPRATERLFYFPVKQPDFMQDVAEGLFRTMLSAAQRNASSPAK